MRQYFWLNREILQNKHFQYFDRSKTRHDRAKIGLAGQHDQPPFKIILSPVLMKSLLEILICNCAHAFIGSLQHFVVLKSHEGQFPFISVLENLIIQYYF